MTYAKMDPEKKAAWVKALRSGEYKQAHGRLRDGDSFCCLGVYCDIRGATWDCGAASWCGRASRNLSLPDGLRGEVGAEAQEDLSFMNDNGKTFDDIAEWIEAKL